MNIASPSTIPFTLQDINQWIGWKCGDPKPDGRRPKIPVSRTGQEISAHTPKNWRDYQTACRQVYEGKADGVGLVLTPQIRIIAIDLDSCRDAKTHALTPDASALVKRFPTYWEVSPSGTGLRGFLKGELPTGYQCNTKGLEIYTANQFVSVTGNSIEGSRSDLSEVDSAFTEWFVSTMPKQPAKVARPTATPAPLAFSDTELITIMRRGKDGDLFARLFDNGDTTGFKSVSEADIRFCGMLAFFTGKDADQMYRLIQQSGLWREKWERDDYREETIGKAIDRCTKVYDPNWKSERETQRNTGGDSCAESGSDTSNGFAVPLSAMLHRLEKDLQRLGVTTTSGYLTFPPNLDYEDAVNIGTILKNGTDRIDVLMRYLWARWYAQLPTRRGVKIRAIEALFPGADGLQAANKQKAFGGDADVVKHVPANAWDFSRPWDFYVHLARLHGKMHGDTEAQTYWLNVKPYKGMYADMTADYAPTREQIETPVSHNAPASTKPVETPQTFDSPPSCVSQYRPKVQEEKPNSCETVTIDITPGMANMLALVAARAQEAGTSPEDYLRSLLEGSVSPVQFSEYVDKHVDELSEISESSYETTEIFDSSKDDAGDYVQRLDDVDAQEVGEALSEPDPTGKALLMPFARLIMAAQRKQLPPQLLTMNGQEIDVNAYVVQVAEPIHFGETLNHPSLPNWLENLRRLQAQYDAQCLPTPEPQREPGPVCTLAGLFGLPYDFDMQGQDVLTCRTLWKRYESLPQRPAGKRPTCYADLRDVMDAELQQPNKT